MPAVPRRQHPSKAAPCGERRLPEPGAPQSPPRVPTRRSPGPGRPDAAHGERRSGGARGLPVSSRPGSGAEPPWSAGGPARLTGGHGHVRCFSEAQTGAVALAAPLRAAPPARKSRPCSVGHGALGRGLGRASRSRPPKGCKKSSGFQGPLGAFGYLLVFFV